MSGEPAGRLEELARVTTEAAEIFSNLSAHREAGAALRLLADSARSRAVDVATLEEMIAYLRRADRDTGRAEAR